MGILLVAGIIVVGFIIFYSLFSGPKYKDVNVREHTRRIRVK